MVTTTMEIEENVAGSVATSVAEKVALNTYGKARSTVHGSPPNVADLFKLQPATEHPHGLTDRDCNSLFTPAKSIIFNFHGYPWLIHRLAYRRTNHRNMHVHANKEKGNIHTPMELAIKTEIDRFGLAIDAIDRTPELQKIGTDAKERYRDLQIGCHDYAYEHGIDDPEVVRWRWPY